MSKLVLIDGHSILNRAFYGLPDFTNSKGMHTNAVYGFLNTMFKIIETEKPDYLAVAFDVSAPTFRHEMFDEYKGTRKPMLPELKQQVPLIKEMLTKMGITIFEKPGFEADDILGTLSLQASDEGIDTVIVSGDRDLLQLASDKVTICIPKTKKGVTTYELYDADEVKEVYSVTPTEFIDVKALMGDSSDNIPGVPGIGEKGATNLIVQFGSIEKAFENADEIANTRNKNALLNNFELAKLSKVLATIDRKVELENSVSNCVLNDIYTDEAYEMVKELEFKNFLDRFSAKDNKTEELFTQIATKEDLDQLMEQAKSATKVSAAYFAKDTIKGFAICFDEDNVYYASCDVFDHDTLAESLAGLASNNNLVVNDLKAHNNVFNATRDNQVFDVALAAYLLNPLANQYETDSLANEYLSMIVPAKEEIFVKTKKGETKSDEITANIMKYCSYEAYVNYLLKDKLVALLEETDMYKLYEDIEYPLLFDLYDMEQVGVKVDGDILKSYSDELGSKIEVLEQHIYSEAGKTFNINSPKQIGEILFGEMGLPGAKKTKTGYSTSAKVLEQLAPDHSIVANILEYRQLAKLKSTYADGLAEYIDDDSRIRGTFNQTITATGRLSSTNPNLQNIPVRMELGRLFRKVFVPSDGCVFVDADYSQIELRILAHMSDDANLIEAYKSSKDIHKATASKVFNVPLDQVTDLQRRNAKAVNFGIVYGISSFGLSQDLSISRKEAEQYIKDYFVNYPGIKKYLDDSVEFAKEEGYSVTLFKRRRPVPELKSGNFMQRQFGERIAMNSPIQGTAADIIKVAMINVAQALRENNLKSRIVLQVHDELLIEAYKNEVEQVKEILETNMKNVVDLKVDLDVEVKTGDSWFEAH